MDGCIDFYQFCLTIEDKKYSCTEGIWTGNMKIRISIDFLEIYNLGRWL